MNCAFTTWNVLLRGKKQIPSSCLKSSRSIKWHAQDTNINNSTGFKILIHQRAHYIKLLSPLYVAYCDLIPSREQRNTTVIQAAHIS